MLESIDDIQNYVETKDPATIASLLRHDQDRTNRGEVPSRLALFLPSANSEGARLICRHLQPEDSLEIPLSVSRLQYAEIVRGIKARLEALDGSKNKSSAFKSTKTTIVSPEDAKATRKLLGNLLRDGSVSQDTRLEDVMKILLSYAHADSTPEPKRPRPKCYICRLTIATPHALYSSLCEPCGQFNIAESSISLPGNLSVVGKTALVTGGRVNLGYHTALRLLRCGAKVIVSSRYPHDAEKRYLAEEDSSAWSHNLSVVGADFRAARDVFQMIAAVKEQLLMWAKGESFGETSQGNLDILINNAAQTLTDSLEAERMAIELEGKLKAQGSGLIISSSYQSRLRGISNTPWLLGNTFQSQSQLKGDINVVSPVPSTKNDALYKVPPKSSWMQFLQQIPYEDFVSAYSVNSFVPLILIRELLPLMGSSTPNLSTSSIIPPKPHAYIINVSSREGLFEDEPASNAKRGHHVHTNMSKAALNMITETEGSRTWHDRRVAMNSVDPGYMSAAPEINAAKKRAGNQACPIGWEDGAGRVLWPIARGEIHGDALWGRFFKHFKEFELKR